MASLALDSGWLWRTLPPVTTVDCSKGHYGLAVVAAGGPDWRRPAREVRGGAPHHRIKGGEGEGQGRGGLASQQPQTVRRRLQGASNRLACRPWGALHIAHLAHEPCVLACRCSCMLCIHFA